MRHVPLLSVLFGTALPLLGCDGRLLRAPSDGGQADARRDASADGVAPDGSTGRDGDGRGGTGPTGDGRASDDAAGGTREGTDGAGGRLDTGGGTNPADGGGADNLATGSTPDAQSAYCGSMLNDPLNCGACGHDCNHLPNVQAGTPIQCHFGQCVVPLSACVHGFGNCNGNGSDGCEADLSQPEHCGFCRRACPQPMPTCVPQGQSFSCLISCVPATPDLCFDTCFDLSSDTGNCGACGNDCNQIPGALTPVPCRAGICEPSCASGWADCTTEAGCETPLDFEDSCGACGGSTGCHLANVSSVCSPGLPGCAEPVCKPGYANCDVVSPEVRLLTTAPGRPNLRQGSGQTVGRAPACSKALTE